MVLRNATTSNAAIGAAPLATKHANEISIEPYRPGDEAAILACMRAAFGGAPRLERWRHLYQENTAGEALILTARAGNEVVSHLALLPRRVRAFGVDGLAGHSIDTMTHPDWQRRGLMAALGGKLERHARQRGLVVTYGVANTQSLHAIIRYERRTPLDPFPVLVRPLRPLAAAMTVARRWIAPPRDAMVECAAAGPVPDPDAQTEGAPATDGWHQPRFDARHTALFDDAEGLPPIALIRDAAHLRWRYPDDPHGPYRQRDIERDGDVVATAIVRTALLAGLKLVFLMEWHWRAGAATAADALVGDAVRLARAMGAHGVAALAARNTPHRRLLAGRGFVPVPEALFPQTSRLTVRVEQPDGDARPWLDAASWYYTWGDGLLL